MISEIQIFNQITNLIAKLSPQYRFKLLEFIVESLKPAYRDESVETTSKPTEKMSGAAFLMSIAGQGKSGQHDVSARDEEILAQEVDPIRGWHVE